MGKPIPLSQVGVPAAVVIPPVTVGGSGPMANFFDKLGRFRSRTASYKRPRTTTLTTSLTSAGTFRSSRCRHPRRLTWAALIAAAEDCDPRVRVLADAWSGLFKLLEAALEKAVFPMGDPSFMAAAGRSVRSPPPTPLPKPVDTSRVLRAALESADKHSVLFDANLGTKVT